MPSGVGQNPERSNHRLLTAAQAFWLGMVLRLKLAGVKTPLAARIADFAQVSVKWISRNLSWDPSFSPFEGKLVTEHQWFVEVADLKYIRIATDSNPSKEGLVASNKFSGVNMQTANLGAARFGTWFPFSWAQ